MKKHLLLYGNSIFMAGLADSLIGRFDISRETWQVFSPPDAILIDLCEAASADALAELCGRGAPVIGIHPGEGRVTVFSGHAHAIHSLTELLEFLLTQATA